jgi:hypothetical protein
MADNIIPDDVKRFILQNIDSIAQWEGLLLLRANPQTEWNKETIAQRLYIRPEEAGELLAKLAAQGFLIISGDSSMLTYRYQPASPDLEHMVTYIAALYRQFLIPITHLIHTKPKARVQKFADAFKLRKDKN